MKERITNVSPWHTAKSPYNQIYKSRRPTFPIRICEGYDCEINTSYPYRYFDVSKQIQGRRKDMECNG